MKAGYVRRFSRIERLLHWVNALGFFFLLATGLILYLPRLSVLVSRRQTIQYIHFWGGVAWLGALVAVIVLGGRRMLATARELDTFDRDDLRWLRGGGAPQGRFNAGQKINAILTAAFAILFGVSGLLLWFGEQDTRYRFASTVLLHDGLMYVSLGLVVGHLYLTLIHPATRHSLRGMTLGNVRDVVVRYLERDGFRTLTAADGDVARALIEEREPSLVVLDVMLPGTDGLSLCRWIRGRSSLPVILLTARGEEADRIVGLELGADDYVTKPFSPRELAARVRSVLRRSNGSSPPRETIAFGEIELDGVSREARREGSAVQLTAKEFELLWFLASHPRHVFSRDQLMARVWGYEAAVDTGTVTVHVRRLREKIEPDPARPRHLRTIWGVGYRLDP